MRLARPEHRRYHPTINSQLLNVWSKENKNALGAGLRIPLTGPRRMSVQFSCSNICLYHCCISNNTWNFWSRLNVRWAMLCVMTRNVWSFPEIDIFSPWHLLYHNAPIMTKLTLISLRALRRLAVQVDIPQRGDGHPKPCLVILAVESVPLAEPVLEELSLMCKTRR